MKSVNCGVDAYFGGTEDRLWHDWNIMTTGQTILKLLMS